MHHFTVSSIPPTNVNQDSANAYARPNYHPNPFPPFHFSSEPVYATSSAGISNSVTTQFPSALQTQYSFTSPSEDASGGGVGRGADTAPVFSVVPEFCGDAPFPDGKDMRSIEENDGDLDEDEGEQITNFFSLHFRQYIFLPISHAFKFSLLISDFCVGRRTTDNALSCDCPSIRIR